MDELVHHCIRELAFEGDLGCDVSRLRDFITDFYAHSGAAQNVDDAYCAFIWSVVVQQPEVRVGIAPEGAPEVYVAPQQKSKKKGEDVAGDESAVASLDLVQDAALRPLEELKAEYGDGLRIAVDPQRSFVALTGSHIRPSRLTPTVYTVLQLISRGRESGISVVDLSKKTGYDPKSCHYLVDKLLELDLIEKRKKSGVGTNFCIHKYFFERSQIWKTVKAEEQEAAHATSVKHEDAVPVGEEDEAMTPAPHLGSIQFEPIDTRHLSSLPLIKARLEKLLKSSPHNMHAAQNLLVTIGFPNPVKSDRRFFKTRLRELIAQGVIEKVQVPRPNGKFVTCIRLLEPDQAEAPNAVPAIPERLENEDEIPTLKTNVTFHRQIVDLIEQSGMEGITLNELSKALCNFDRRIIEHQLSRLQQVPPPHLADLHITQLVESHGRERRHRYFTAANYMLVAERETLEIDNPADLSHVGEFMAVDDRLFYKDEDALTRYVDDFPMDEVVAPKTKTMAKSHKKRTNPVLADGSIKRGRPKKPDGETKRGKKRKRDAEEEAVGADESTAAAGEPPAKKPRGRPRKSQPVVDAADKSASAVGPSAAASAPASAEKVPKKRGRPPKPRPVVEDAAASGEGTSVAGPSVSAPVEEVPKRRGRPPKVRTEALETPTPTPKKRGRPPKKKHDIAEVDLIVSPAVDKMGGSAAQHEGQPAEEASEEAAGVDGELTGPIPVTDSTPATAGAAEAAAAEQSTMTVDEAVLLAPAHEATTVSEPLSPHTARIRRSTRVRRPRLRDDDALPISGTPTPVRRRAAERKPASPATEETDAMMGVDSVPQSLSGQTTPLAVAGSASTPEDVAMVEAPAQEIVEQLVGISTAPEGQAGLQTPVESASVNTAFPLQQSGSQSDIPAVEASVSQTTEGTQQKRAEPDTPSIQPLPKRAKTSGPATAHRVRVNISQSRREKELLRVIEDAGGVMNIGTKEVYEAHAALVDTLTKTGEPTSTLPGSRIDKRTLESTLRDLESQGKIKLVSTSVQNATGVSRLVKIAYLADTSPEVLNGFLLRLNHTPVPVAQPVLKTLDEPLEYGGSKSQRISRPAASVILLTAESNSQDDSQKVIKLLQSDDKTIQASLLTEPSTVMQLYGFIVGKIARARALHLHSLGLFGAQRTSTNIVSTEHRIIHLSHYLQDLPVSVHCAVISCRTQNDELMKLLSNPEGRLTPVGQLTSRIADDLEVSKSRSRTRLMDLLGVLYGLGLIVPLQKSESQEPFLRCSQNGDHPTAFDATTYDGSATLSVPQYWHFNTNVPIHLWALSDKDPPFWRTVPVQDAGAASEYWKNLMRASTDVDFAKDALSGSNAATAYPVHPAASTSLAKLLRRPTQWKSSYNFSWFQKQYLRRQQDSLTADTPLQLDDSDTHLEKIAEIVSAPKDEVARFYESERSKLLRAVEKEKAKHNRDQTEETARRKAEEQATLAQKAAAAQAQREKDWEEILRRVHPEPIKGSLLTRIRQVKSRYMQAAGTDVPKWEAEVAAVIEEIKKIPAKRKTGTSKPPLHSHRPVRTLPLLPLLTVPTHDKPVEDIIALQGPPIINRPGKEVKKKGKETAVEGTKEAAAEEEDGNGRTRRRHRFQWNKDFDELARDAAVIIKARCRDGKRLDWAALERVFPAVPRNSVRQRISSLREQPGAEAYTKRLEDRWYELWQTHLDTAELPDEDPSSPSNFDIVAHIKFLRNHIDKNALRVGFLQEELPITAVLPLTADALCQKWDIVEKVPTSTMWDFMWNGNAEESREKQFVQQAFLAGGSEIPAAKKYSSEAIYVADAALKMTLGTPNETYDPEDGSRLLASVGEPYVKMAVAELLERGVVSKVVRDPKKIKPGRLLKISEVNQNALGGSIHEDLFQDAAALEELLCRHQQEGNWHDWPLSASDGDTAALIELVSENKVELKVDTTHPRAARANLDWNSKKTDDDDIETMITIRLKDVPLRTAQRPTSAEMLATTSADLVTDIVDVHDNVNTLGQKACCRRTSTGPVDCVACLSIQSTELQGKNLDERQSNVYRRLERILREAGSAGVTKAYLVASFESSEHELLKTIVNVMVNEDIPMAFWLGYDEIVLVSSYHVTTWTVLISENDAGRTRLFPRRWLDIDGRTLNEVWEAAHRAVIGIILFHPGISQAELRWRLRSGYDRQELLDVLAHLLEQGYLRRHVEGRPLFDLGPATNDEEHLILWTIGEKKYWYTV